MNQHKNLKKKNQANWYSAVLPAVLIIAVIAGGCAPPELPAPGKPSSILGEFAGISFEIKNPVPDGKVFIGNKFAPSIRIEGNGEGTVCITGLSRESFRGFSGCECQTFSISEEDGYKDVVFGDYEVQGPSGGNSVTAIVKYRSTAKAKANLILKQEAVDKLLPLSERSTGAVMIKEVEETIQPAGTKGRISLILTIKLEDAGDGRVYDAGKVNIQSCRIDETDRKLIVKIKDIPFVGDAECETTSFEGREAEAVCNIGELSLLSRGQSIAGEDYAPKIRIEADYGYAEAETSAFNVVG